MIPSCFDLDTGEKASASVGVHPDSRNQEEEIMSEGMTLNTQTVQETMLIPLWGRARFSQLYPELLDDPRAAEIIEQGTHDELMRAAGLYRRMWDEQQKIRTWKFGEAAPQAVVAAPQPELARVVG
jgi:hypothetical protein